MRQNYYFRSVNVTCLNTRSLLKEKDFFYLKTIIKNDKKTLNFSCFLHGANSI
jgi:hypothetical protein